MLNKNTKEKKKITIEPFGLCAMINGLFGDRFYDRLTRLNVFPILSVKVFFLRCRLQTAKH